MRFFIILILLIPGGYWQKVLSQSDAIILDIFEVPESKQGVTVDSDHFFVINNHSITKHSKTTGELVGSWKDTDGVLKHMNSGRIFNDTIFVCNSNYPDSPMASSIELFDKSTLHHIGNISIGISYGSATWMDRYKGHNYVMYAHYNGKGSELGKSNRWTTLVKYTFDWVPLGSWLMPESILDKLNGYSSSGGRILPNGHILITGHDDHELYELKFPSMGYTLEQVNTYLVGSFGQGIDYEHDGEKEKIYGIIKKENKVVISEIITTLH